MIAKLKELLPEYEGMTDAEVAADLNAEYQAPNEYMLTDVRLAAVIGTVKTVTIIGAFKAQGDPVSLWIVDKLATTGLDVGNPEAPAFIQPLVTAGVVTQAEADGILALGKRTTTKAQELGLGEVKDYHVTEARNG